MENQRDGRNYIVAQLCYEMWEAVSFCLVLRVLKLPLCPLVHQCLPKGKGKLEKKDGVYEGRMLQINPE